MGIMSPTEITEKFEEIFAAKIKLMNEEMDKCFDTSLKAGLITPLEGEVFFHLKVGQTRIHSKYSVVEFQKAFVERLNSTGWVCGSWNVIDEEGIYKYYLNFTAAKKT